MCAPGGKVREVGQGSLSPLNRQEQFPHESRDRAHRLKTGNQPRGGTGRLCLEQLRDQLDKCPKIYGKRDIFRFLL